MKIFYIILSVLALAGFITVTGLIYGSYELLSGLIPAAVVLFVIYKKKKLKMEFSHKAGLFIFCVYITAVFFVTGAGTIYESLQIGKISGEINIVPFNEEIFSMTNILNIIMTVPFGFMAPLLWENNRKFKSILLSGLGFSLLIELSQLFTHRATDINDLIMNTIGVLAGWAVFKIINRFKEFKSSESIRYENIIFIAVVFAGRFFLYDGMGLALLLLQYNIS